MGESSIGQWTPPLNILIVEDEPRAAKRLARMIKNVRPNASVYDPIANIKSACRWFSNNAPPDLVFLDIQLEDGDGFTLLEKADVAAPIIFCTAYAEFAIEAFKANSIDYLLKPVDAASLNAALNKYERLTDLNVPPEAWRHLRGYREKPAYRRRFLIKGRRGMRVVPVAEIIAASSWLKATRLIAITGEVVEFEETLTGVSATLDPAEFFQISRQNIVRLSEIEEITRIDGCAVVRLGKAGMAFNVSRARLAGLETALQKLCL